MTNRMDSAAALTPRRRKSQLHWQLLLMVLPALIYLLIFHYKPMYGVVIAFKNYKFKLGILGRTMNLPGRSGRKISVAAYKVAQKVIGFN